MRASYTSLAAIALIMSAAMAPTAKAETTGQYIDDATITTKVKAALISDSQIRNPAQINVRTDKGTVQLSGTVETPAQESEAIKVANRINGVKTVKDLMNVSNTQED